MAESECESAGMQKCTKSPQLQHCLGSKTTQTTDEATGLLRVEFIINTYPDLQPFLEMAVLLLEGVYEHKHNIQKR